MEQHFTKQNSPLQYQRDIETNTCLSSSVTRWLDYMFNVWIFTTISINLLPKQVQNVAKYYLSPE